MNRGSLCWSEASENRFQSRGGLHFSPVKRPKSPSVVTHSLPDSMASAARYASGYEITSSVGVSAKPREYGPVPLAWRYAHAVGLGPYHFGKLECRIERSWRVEHPRWVTIRRNPLSTRSEMPKELSEFTRSLKPGFYDGVVWRVSRKAWTNMLTSRRNTRLLMRSRRAAASSRSTPGWSPCP